MSQSMNDYYTDFEELRPIGEASHIPDEKLSECGDSAAHRQRVATTEKGYPNDATESNTECRSCGASVPDGQTKCRFCLTNHLESDAASTNESASTTFLGIIHLIVESTTFYGAVAKGGAAANLLCQPGGARRRRLHAHLRPRRGAGARQLAEQWPSLPDAVQVSSAEGEGLSVPPVTGLGAHGQEASERQEQAPTRLYDQRGTASATRRVLTRSSTTPTTRCGWFQRWR